MLLTQEKKERLKKLTALDGNKDISLEEVLRSFDSLEALDVDLTRTPSRSGAGTLIPAKDTVKPSETNPESLLACSHLPIKARQITLGSIMLSDE